MKRNLRGLLLFTRKVLAYFSFRRDNDKRGYEKLFITALGGMTRTAMQAATKTEHLSRNRRGDRMKICIEESTYEGTPIEILTQLRAQCHLVSKEGTSQRQHTAKRKQAVCCLLRH